MRQSWTDDRLDSLNEKVDRRFDEIDRRFDEIDRRFDISDREVQRRFDEVDRRLDGFEGDIREMRSLIIMTSEAAQGRLESVQRSMIYLAVGLTTGMLAGFGGMTVLLATQI